MDTKTVIFFCNWSTNPGLQLSRFPAYELGTKQKYIVSMCSGRISPEIILKIFQKKIGGVLIAACPQDACEHDGNYKTVGRVALLKIMLHQMGINPERLQLSWIDKGEAAKLKQEVQTFYDKINQLGPIE